MKIHDIEDAEFRYSESSVHALVLFEPKFTYTALKELSVMEEAQRIFYAKLAQGACNIGHLHYLNVLDVIKLPFGPRVLPDLKGSNTAMVMLPEWFSSTMCRDLEIAGTSLPWVQERCACVVLRLPKVHACLVAHGLMESIAVCDLSCNKRTDLKFSGWGIGWDRFRHQAEAGGSHKRQSEELEPLYAVRDALTAHHQDLLAPASLIGR